MSRRRLGAVAALAVAVAGLAGCGGDDEVAGPVIDQLQPAVAAVEEELGGPQEYFQLIATDDWVEVTVAAENATLARQFLYVDGNVASTNGDGQPASGSTFTGPEALTFDDDVLHQVLDDFGDTTEQFLILGTGTPEQPVRFSALVQSGEGGVLEVVVDADGKVLEAGPFELDPGAVPGTIAG